MGNVKSSGSFCLKSDFSLPHFFPFALPDLCCRKEILQEYFDISTLLHHEVVKLHREMSAALTAINPDSEYDNFIHQNR